MRAMVVRNTRCKRQMHRDLEDLAAFRPSAQTAGSIRDQLNVTDLSNYRGERVLSLWSSSSAHLGVQQPVAVR